jgi:hypothetical protein
MNRIIPTGILMIDFYERLSHESSPKFRNVEVKRSDIPIENLQAKLHPNNGIYIKIVNLTELEMSTFGNQPANTFKVSLPISKRLKKNLNETNPSFDVLSSTSPYSDIRHYFPVYAGKVTRSIMRAYFDLIMEATHHCLRYEITEDSIIALTESRQFSEAIPNENRFVHTFYPRWQFHFKFFESLKVIPLSFESTSSQMVALGSRYVVSRTYSIEDDGIEEKGIQKESYIKDRINLIDRELLEIVNEMTENEFNTIDDEYKNYLVNYENDIRHDKKVKKFELTKYHTNIIEILWNRDSNHKGVNDVITHLKNIVTKIQKLHDNLKLNYLFKVTQYMDDYVVQEYDEFRSKQGSKKLS